MCLSPDGLHLAQSLLSTRDPAVRFWNTQTGKEEGTFNGMYLFPHQDIDKGVSFAVNRNSLVWAAFSSDGEKLNAVDSKGNRIRLGLATAQQENNTPSLPQDVGQVIAVSPDNNTLVTLEGTKNQQILLWSQGFGRPKGQLAGRQLPLKSVIFSPDSRTLASRENGNTIKILNAANAHLIRTLPKRQGVVAALAFSPDGKTPVSSNDIFTKPMHVELRFWNLSDGTEKQPLIIAPDFIERLTFSPNGYLVGTGSKSVYFWNTTTGQLIATLPGCWPVVFDKTGKIMVCGEGDGFEMFKNASVWDIS